MQQPWQVLSPSSIAAKGSQHSYCLTSILSWLSLPTHVDAIPRYVAKGKVALTKT